MDKYLFLIGAIIILFLGAREFLYSTKDVIDYYDESQSTYSKINKSQINVLTTKTIKHGAGNNNPSVSIVILNKKKVAIYNIPDAQEFLIKKFPRAKEEVEYTFSNSYETYKAISNIYLFFISNFAICLLVIFLGLLFCVASYVKWKRI